MFQDFIICIFSYNRAQLLQNLLDSIQDFYPDMAIAIFDDASTDAAVLNILQNAEERGVYVERGRKSTVDNQHGGLYNNMNAALAYAINENYKYAYFVQDDMQFLWRDENLNISLSSIFNGNECMMTNHNFLQKITKNGIESKLLPKEGMFLFDKRGVVDTGIIDVDKARNANLYLAENSELGNGLFWYEKGFRLYWIPAPHLAWVPWPTTYRFKSGTNRKLNVLRSLNQNKIDHIRKNRSYAFLEDYSSTTQFMLKPYWYSVSPGVFSLIKIYAKYFLGMRIMK